MVTNPKAAPRPIYLREWRKFMGVKAVVLAQLLEIERESYYRLERETYRINLAELSQLADEIGIRPDQFWWHPPTAKAVKNVSLNDLIENQPDNIQAMAIKAVRGMVEK